MILNNFFKKGSPGQTTKLPRMVSTFWENCGLYSPDLSPRPENHINKNPNVVSWPECQRFWRHQGNIGSIVISVMVIFLVLLKFYMAEQYVPILQAEVQFLQDTYPESRVLPSFLDTYLGSS